MTHPTLIIGNRNYSSWSLRPWFFLRKNEIQLSLRQLWLDEPEFKPAIAEYGSGGKVPVLLDGELIVWDSLAIIEYAIERYDCAFGWPADRRQRAHARSISCEMHSSFSALREECSMDIRNRNHTQLSPAARADIDRICEIWGQALEMSGNRGQWLYSEFSAADAMFVPVVFRLIGYGIEVNPQAQAYIDFVLADAQLGEWVQAARDEGHTLLNH